MLDLGGCNELTDDTMRGMHCLLLTSLVLRRCYNITSEGLRFISEGCPSLEYLDVGHCNHIGDSGLQVPSPPRYDVVQICDRYRNHALVARLHSSRTPDSGELLWHHLRRDDEPGKRLPMSCASRCWKLWHHRRRSFAPVPRLHCSPISRPAQLS
jgi:hypothetical protein